MIKKVTILTASLCLLFTMWSPAVYIHCRRKDKARLLLRIATFWQTILIILLFPARAQSNVIITDIGWNTRLNK